MAKEHSTKPPAGPKEPTRYLVGYIDALRGQLNCCPYSGSLVGVDPDTCWERVIALPCKRWGCKWCGPKKALRLAYKCETAHPTKFITLTVDPKRYLDPRSAYDGTRRKISDFAKTVRLHVGEFEYIRVLEATEKGWPHYHFCARSTFIPQSFLSREWDKLTGAPIVDIRAIHKRESVFRYMMKYLCKQKYVPWTERRVTWTKNFFPTLQPAEERSSNCCKSHRNKAHPADYLANHWPGKTIIETSPGSYLVEGAASGYRYVNPSITEQRTEQCRSKQSPSPALRPSEMKP